MYILNLSKELSKSDFKEALDYMKTANDAGLLFELLELIEEFDEQGYTGMAAIHSAYWDTLIDSDTGKYKSEIENLVSGSR
jgi:hypothetical protein